MTPRHFPRALAGLIVTILLLVGPALQAQNLLKDGGLEHGKAGAWDAIWTRTPNTGTSERDVSISHGGRAAMKIVHRGTRDWSVAASERIAVEPGEIYAFGAWLKLQETGEAQLSVITRDAAEQVVDWQYALISTSGTHDWTQLQRRLVVPAGVTSIQFRLTGAGAGTVWMDDADLHKIGHVGEMTGATRADVMQLSNAVIDVSVMPIDGRLTITDKRTGQAWQQSAPAQNVIITGAQQQADRIVLSMWDVANDLDLKATIAVDPGRPEVVVELTGNGALATPIAYPRPFVTGPGTTLVVPMNEGILFPVDDATVSPMYLVAYGGHGICMPWYGVTDTASGAGVMTLLHTPDDARINITRAGGADLYIQPEWESSRQAFRYARSARFIVFDTGGYVAMCKRYRAHAKETGLLKTLSEKRAENQNVDRLIGAANIWNWDMDAVALCREMKDLGMDRILWSRGGSPGWGQEPGGETLRQINEMGFLTSRYDIYQDVMNPAQFPKLRYIHGDWPIEAWPDDLMRAAHGDWVKGWPVEVKDDGPMIPCGVLCDRVAPPYARRRIAAELKTEPYLGRFIDTTTATPWRECYDPRHPMTRTDSKQSKMKLLEVVSGEFNLVTGCETGHDAAVPYLHFFEGMLSLGPYRVEEAGRDMLAYKPPTPDLIKYQIGPYYRVPLWELVYHDCVVSMWYWGDYNNKLPEFWPQRDLFNVLYGTPPMYMFDRATWEKDKARFVESYRRICPTVRQVGYLEMLDHTFLTDDHTVQRTRFADGTQVVINLGDKPHTLDDGRTIGPMDSLVTGPGATE